MQPIELRKLLFDKLLTAGAKSVGVQHDNGIYTVRIGGARTETVVEETGAFSTIKEVHHVLTWKCRTLAELEAFVNGLGSSPTVRDKINQMNQL